MSLEGLRQYRQKPYLEDALTFTRQVTKGMLASLKDELSQTEVFARYNNLSEANLDSTFDNVDELVQTISVSISELIYNCLDRSKIDEIGLLSIDLALFEANQQAEIDWSKDCIRFLQFLSNARFVHPKPLTHKVPEFIYLALNSLPAHEAATFLEELFSLVFLYVELGENFPIAHSFILKDFIDDFEHKQTNIYFPIECDLCYRDVLRVLHPSEFGFFEDLDQTMAFIAKCLSSLRKEKLINRKRQELLLKRYSDLMNSFDNYEHPLAEKNLLRGNVLSFPKNHEEK